MLLFVSVCLAGVVGSGCCWLSHVRHNKCLTVLVFCFASGCTTLIPRLSGPRSYGHFGLPGTLGASFSGNITTPLSLCVEKVTSHAMFCAHLCTFPIKMYMIRSYGHFKVTGSARSRTARINEV